MIRSTQPRYALRLASLAAALALATAAPLPLAASPTGLNNIPTADTAPVGVGVFQFYSVFGEGTQPGHTGGFKTGLQPAGAGHKFEAGFDSHLAPGNSGPVTFQVKYALPLGDKLPALGLGSANLAVTGNDRDRAGQPFTYAVLTHDFTAFRAHVGYGFQRKGDAAFVGIDKTVKVGGRDLVLRSDLVQIDDRSQWLGSAGFLLVLHKNWVLEAWASQPTERGEARFTLKLNYVMKY